jgi:hypothetical protein
MHFLGFTAACSHPVLWLAVLQFHKMYSLGAAQVTERY